MFIWPWSTLARHKSEIPAYAFSVPELPDVTVYVERLGALLAGKPLTGVRVKSPFVVRSYDPPLADAVGRRLGSLFRVGKRIVFVFEPELCLVVHLMIAGRFQLKEAGAKLAKITLLSLDFPDASLLLTEASSQKRASLHVVRTQAEAWAMDRGGVEPLTASIAEISRALLAENRTLKRALTDPRIVSGIGNAYSDEILFRAQLSPMKRSGDLDEAELVRLIEAMRSVLLEWTERLREEVGQGFPEKVTAFRQEMCVHGKFKQPCRVCGSPVQRIVYAANECNYCATCQTGGRLLADRALSRLLHDDWPKTLEELEERKSGTSSR
jgi:formamidopyrimidine-DNA glycosylase